jgi:hypothetical protein
MIRTCSKCRTHIEVKHVICKAQNEKEVSIYRCKACFKAIPGFTYKEYIVQGVEDSKETAVIEPYFFD